MSLSQEPTLSALNKYFVCGVRDITGESYAGASGRHDNFGNAIVTTNGAGPHNIQIFMLAADGTVLNCLPGYWSTQDLYQEISLAYQLNQIWQNQSLSVGDKQTYFRTMQLAHIQHHSPAMSRRSRMQGFDLQYEKEHRPNSDFFSGYPNGRAKTVDVVMHQRMAARPFVAYEHFDVANYCDYGKPMYDKEEDYRDSSGHVDQFAARGAPKLGNLESTSRKGYREQPDPRLWGQDQSGTSRKLWGQEQMPAGSTTWGLAK
ncbi:MAG: hypothetical protein C5B53_03280 [Candidatus Melainabacteria bacterium]|nr:MAG: hypothetical protein C5B53_03280 [Candidatus Melainabacteria bacterium]